MIRGNIVLNSEQNSLAVSSLWCTFVSVNSRLIPIRASERPSQKRLDNLDERLRSLNENVDVLSRLVTSLVPKQQSAKPYARGRVICISGGSAVPRGRCAPQMPAPLEIPRAKANSAT